LERYSEQEIGGGTAYRSKAGFVDDLVCAHNDREESERQFHNCRGPRQWQIAARLEPIGGKVLFGWYSRRVQAGLGPGGRFGLAKAQTGRLCPANFLFDPGRGAQIFGGKAGVFMQKVGVTHNSGQWIIDLMSRTSGETPERHHFLRLHDAGLHRL
jgi:hypothetical protein